MARPGGAGSACHGWGWRGVARLGQAGWAWGHEAGRVKARLGEAGMDDDEFLDATEEQAHVIKETR